MRRRWLLGAIVLASSPATTQPSVSPAAAEAAALKTALESIARCERAAGPDDIVVCGRRDELSPYRIPPGLPPPEGDPRSTSVSRARNALIERGADGLGSCSPVGPGGETGCQAQAARRRCEQLARMFC